MYSRIVQACRYTRGNWQALRDFWPHNSHRTMIRAAISVTRNVTIPGVLSILSGEYTQ